MYPIGHEPIYNIKLQVKMQAKPINTDTEGGIESVRAYEQGWIKRKRKGFPWWENKCEKKYLK